MIWSVNVTRIVVLLLSLMFAGFAAPGRTAPDEEKPESATRSERRVDINRASMAELKTLPGIRDAYASAIVRNRPYKNKAQLLSRQVIPEAAYGKIRNKIVARQ
jgi:DNA uptake protein ComE-like DNA-binding protein